MVLRIREEHRACWILALEINTGRVDRQKKVDLGGDTSRVRLHKIDIGRVRLH